MAGIAAPAYDRDLFATEVRVALEPDATYGRLLNAEPEITAWRMLMRPAMVLLVIGVVVPVMAVQRVTLGLVATASRR